MKFATTEIPDVVYITAAPVVDERGLFARLFCPEEFARAGIAFSSTQINLSRNARKHTLRGMHWQDAPFAEAKVVRCVQGTLYDVVVDLRRDSPAYKRWIARELAAERMDALFIPEGCAHGFLTLTENCDVLYQMGRLYEPGKAAGFCYDDPAFAIRWPFAPQVINEADRNWKPFVA